MMIVHLDFDVLYHIYTTIIYSTRNETLDIAFA
jgi:hypothetical protein